MKNVTRYGVIAASVAAFTIASPTFAMVSGGDSHGQSYDSANIYQRSITIRPNTKYVNVNAGEIVRFVDQASGKSFIWKFGGVTRDDGGYSFDLATVAPRGIVNGAVTAYVGPELRGNNK